MPTLTTLADLCWASPREPWHAHLVLPEIGGGRLALSDLAALEQKPNATVLTVSGLDQRTFEALVRGHGSRFTGIHFWKCPRIEDLTPLEDLQGLTHVALFWNQRTNRLWNFTRTPNLLGLSFQDFTRLHDLCDLANGTSIAELRFGDAVWSKSTFPSLSPLASMVGLKTLDFDAKRIDDGQIQPLAQLANIQKLDFSPRQFTTQQVAWLRARLPAHVEGRSLAPFIRLEGMIAEAGGEVRDLLVVGKRKPRFSSSDDSGLLQQYVDEFWRSVERYRSHPDAQPEE